MKKLWCVCLLLISACQAQQPDFKLVPLTVGTTEIQVQLADTVDRRMRGLMEQSPLQHGMLLLYESPREMTLWMKNTPSALDVAFIDKNWVITKIQPMEPNSEALHTSPGEVIAALEMPQGWFASQQIKPGTRIKSCQTLPGHCPK